MTTDPDPVHFELAWAPPSYSTLTPSEIGEWRIVELPLGNPAGIVWTDRNNGAGFVPLDAERYPNSSLASTTLSGMFSSAISSGLSAYQAYETILSYSPLAVSQPCRGKLGNVLAIAGNPETRLPQCEPNTQAVTAAASATDSSSTDSAAEPVENESIFAVLDDSGNLLELGRSDPTGVYVRSNGSWFRVPPEADALDGKVWQDVTPEAVSVYDEAEKSGRTPTADDLKKFFVTTSE